MHRLEFTGFQPAAAEYERPPLSLDGLLAPRPRQTFFVRFSGDALMDDGFADGDILVVERVLRFPPGSYVVAFVGGERLVRKFVQEGMDFYLRPANKNYRDIEVTDAVELFGLVTARVTVFRPLKSQINGAS